MILDVMPIDENVLKFSNRWYKEAIEHSITHELDDNLIIMDSLCDGLLISGDIAEAPCLEEAKYSPFSNLLVEAEHAEYQRPEVQKIIYTE